MVSDRPASVVETVLVVELIVGDLHSALGELMAVGDNTTRRLGPVGTTRVRLEHFIAFHFILLKTTQLSQTVTTHTELDSKATKHRQLPMS